MRARLQQSRHCGWTCAAEGNVGVKLGKAVSCTVHCNGKVRQSLKGRADFRVPCLSTGPTAKIEHARKVPVNVQKTGAKRYFPTIGNGLSSLKH